LLVSVISSSSFLTRLILRDPSLIESIGREGYFEELINPEVLEKHFDLMQYAYPNEPLRDVLLRVQNSAMFRCGMRFIMGMTDVEKVSLELTHIADFILMKSMSTAKESLKERYPDFTEQHGDDIAVIGFGKLGGQDFNVASDCDVMFIYPEYKAAGDCGSSDYFHRWATKYIEVLESNGPLGYLYKVDARLRPHGSGSPLANSVKALKEYYQNQAQFWEKMALSRARFIAGNNEAEGLLKELKEEAIFQSKPAKEEIKSILDMRKKIEEQKRGETLKAAPGGLMDVEFISQALVLYYGSEYQEIRSQNTLANLRNASDLNLIPKEDARILIDSYLFMREVENRLRIVNNVSIDAIPTDQKELEKLTRRYALRMENNKPTAASFIHSLKNREQSVRKVFNRFFDDLINSFQRNTE